MSTGNHGSVSSERAIENLISSYAFLNDDADIAGLGELFADAVCTLDETTARGRDEIEQLARGIIQVNEDRHIPDPAQHHQPHHRGRRRGRDG
jgi:ketosteroid isomerase-like protein